MALAPEVIGSIVGAGSGLLNTGLNALNVGAQTKAAKELMQYQWNNFQSPKAQVAAMGAAGLNAGALLGEGKGSFAAPSVAMPSSVPAQIDGVANMANYLVAKAQAKKAGVETEGTELDNAVKRATQDERIRQIGLNNKWTEEQTTKVINEWQKLVGEVNILQTESEIKKIDLAKHEKLVDGLIDSYVKRANLDAAQEESLRKQLPIILDKLESEKEILSVDAEIAQDFKGTMTQLGVVGDAVKILMNLIKIFK